MTRRISAALALASLLVLPACDDDNAPAEPSFTETFALAVTGDMPGTVSGRAYFGTDLSAEGDPIFGIILNNAASTRTLMLIKEGTSRPEVGEYDIAPFGTSGGEWTALYLIEDGAAAGMVVGTEGTLRITRSSDGRLTGTLDMDASGLYGGEEEPVEITVAISGSFDAGPAVD